MYDLTTGQIFSMWLYYNNMYGISTDNKLLLILLTKNGLLFIVH